MTPFCTTAQYVARYGSVSDLTMLQECLEDCTAQICADLDAHEIEYTDPSETFSDQLMRVCRSMANRLMPGHGDDDLPVGITQMSETTGPYNAQYTFATAYGTPKMLPSEMRMLGIGARIGCGAIGSGNG